jgi:hypothetical protein
MSDYSQSAVSNRHSGISMQHLVFHSRNGTQPLANSISQPVESRMAQIGNPAANGREKAQIFLCVFIFMCIHFYARSFC